MQETWVQSLGWEDSLEEVIATHSSILAWRIYGQRSLAGYSPWGYRESDTTERLGVFNRLDNVIFHILRVDKLIPLVIVNFVLPCSIFFQAVM